MRVILYFRRLFTKGTLVGIYHRDQLPFLDVVSAHQWLAGVSANAARGVLDYVVVEHDFKPLPDAEPAPRVELTRALDGKWKVMQGAWVLFHGNRPRAKQAAADHARSQGFKSWFNEKDGGNWVEIYL